MSRHFGVQSPPAGAAQSFGLMIFGDEAEIYKDCQYMCISWSSEQSPFWSDPMKSRYLVCLLPVHRYAFHNGVKVTIQEAMRTICTSLNHWQNQGLTGVYCRFVSLKGDWKWLVQCLNLTRKPGKNAFCFLCPATRNMDCPMTDLSSDAAWKSVLPPCPWSVEPAILELQNFSLGTVGLDILHIWHIGTGRDLASSCLLILLRLGAFPGNNVALRQYWRGMYVSPKSGTNELYIQEN